MKIIDVLLLVIYKDITKVRATLCHFLHHELHHRLCREVPAIHFLYGYLDADCAKASHVPPQEQPMELGAVRRLLPVQCWVQRVWSASQTAMRRGCGRFKNR